MVTDITHIIAKVHQEEQDKLAKAVEKLQAIAFQRATSRVGILEQAKQILEPINTAEMDSLHTLHTEGVVYAIPEHDLQFLRDSINSIIRSLPQPVKQQHEGRINDITVILGINK